MINDFKFFIYMLALCCDYFDMDLFFIIFLIPNFLIYLLWKSLSYIEDQKERTGNVAVTVESFHVVFRILGHQGYSWNLQ